MRKLALSDDILMRVEKPARYVGGELNAVMKDKDKIDYHVFKPVLFEFPTYEYFIMGGKIGNCGKMNQ